MADAIDRQARDGLEEIWREMSKLRDKILGLRAALATLRQDDGGDTFARAGNKYNQDAIERLELRVGVLEHDRRIARQNAIAPTDTSAEFKVMASLVRDWSGCICIQELDCHPGTHEWHCPRHGNILKR